MKTAKSLYYFLLILFVLTLSVFSEGVEEQVQRPVPDAELTAKLPIGMNIPDLKYYRTSLVFNDVMTTASPMITYHGDYWDTKLFQEMEIDENGYPMYLPQPTSDGENSKARFLVNNYYYGRYRVFYEGIGTLSGSHLQSDNEGYYIDFTGDGENCWINITTSQKGNHLRNIRIIPDGFTPADLVNGSLSIFIGSYMEGLKGFHALRFMDWSGTNNSKQVYWEDRVTKEYYTQGGYLGASFDYAIDLCNELQADAWVCVPHMASDDYIIQQAQLFKDNLNPHLKIYLEYSNEVWNGMFEQALWIQNNASYPPAVDSYVSEDLAEIHSGDDMLTEKSAYMMARLFTLWEQVFGDEMENRVVRVATSQHAVPDKSRRILGYLFNEDNPFGAVGCDTLAVGGYFGYTTENHQAWLRKGETLTNEDIYRDVYYTFLNQSYHWTMGSAGIAHEYGVDYMVYEGGQHMNPFQAKVDWNYSDIFFDFQKNERMYDLYIHNFNLHMEENIDCELFMAYSYISPRRYRYGSWGHLESLSQVGGSYEDAPKYRALLDANL
ncbi:MAG: hypothetical protein PQJ59_17065 [Spirochaetales bacterium]|nr:hypothetical protein [Spirochaetales bacterium]